MALKIASFPGTWGFLGEEGQQKTHSKISNVTQIPYCILSIDVKDLVPFMGKNTFCHFVVCDSSLHEFTERSDRISDHKLPRIKVF